MRIIDHINFNKECISLYMKENIDRIYNSKIYALIQENIKLYRLLDKYKKHRPKQKETLVEKEYKPLFGESVYKENTIESFYGSYDNYLQFNK